jgi:hypothetical protein
MQSVRDATADEAARWHAGIGDDTLIAWPWRTGENDHGVFLATKPRLKVVSLRRLYADVGEPPAAA